MVGAGEFRRRRERREGVDPASDGSANAERRERQSGLRRAMRERFPDRGRHNLLPALHFLQHEHGFLPEWALQVVGWHLRAPASEVYGAATSYSELRLEPPPERNIAVCAGLACWLAGGDELLATARQQAGDDGGNAIATTACAYMCGVAPAVRVNGRWLGRMDAVRLSAALAQV